MTNLLCKLGFHRPYEFVYLKVTKHHSNGKKYHRNYLVCKRCQKRLATLRKFKTGGKTNG